MHWYARVACLLAVLTGCARAQGLPVAVAEPLRAGDYAKALAAADALLKTASDNAALWTARGMALGGLKRAGDSLVSFDKALALSAGYLPALRAASDAAYRLRDPRAASYLERLIAVQPRDPIANAMRGVLHFENGDCAGAVVRFEDARAQIEADVLAAAMFGQCLLRMDRASDAVAVLERNLARHGGSPDARYNLAAALASSGRTADAVATLEPLVAQGEAMPAALSLLGVLRARQGDTAAALEVLTKAVAMAPSNERVYLDFAIVCAEHRQWQRGLEVTAQGVDNVPRSARLRSMRGVILVQLGRFEEAVEDFDQADLLEPRFALGTLGQSVLMTDQGRPEEAAAAIRARLKIEPDNALLHFLLADTLMRGGAEPGQPEFAEARRALERSLAIRPGFSRAHALLGKLLRRAGETGQAIAALETALRIDPSNRQALQQLTLLLRQSQRGDEAARLALRLRQRLSVESGAGRPSPIP